MGGGGGGRGTWVNFCWVCAAGLSEPLPLYPHLSHFWVKCNFSDPNLVTFCLCINLT